MHLEDEDFIIRSISNSTTTFLNTVRVLILAETDENWDEVIISAILHKRICFILYYSLLL